MTHVSIAEIECDDGIEESLISDAPVILFISHSLSQLCSPIALTAIAVPVYSTSAGSGWSIWIHHHLEFESDADACDSL